MGVKSKMENDWQTVNKEIQLEEMVVGMLQQKGLTISCAESCTGGLLTGRIVNVSGASDVLQQSFVTYSNDAKRKLLKVKKKTLKKYGAVSKQTAKEMAKGVAKASKAEVGVGVTGIAGPYGGTAEKPVGLVYIGVSYKEKTTVKKCLFTGNRQQVREAAVEKALRMVYKKLKKEDAGKK